MFLIHMYVYFCIFYNCNLFLLLELYVVTKLSAFLPLAFFFLGKSKASQTKLYEVCRQHVALKHGITDDTSRKVLKF